MNQTRKIAVVLLLMALPLGFVQETFAKDDKKWDSIHVRLLNNRGAAATIATVGVREIQELAEYERSVSKGKNVLVEAGKNVLVEADKAVNKVLKIYNAWKLIKKTITVSKFASIKARMGGEDPHGYIIAATGSLIARSAGAAIGAKGGAAIGVKIGKGGGAIGGVIGGAIGGAIGAEMGARVADLIFSEKNEKYRARLINSQLLSRRPKSSWSKEDAIAKFQVVNDLRQSFTNRGFLTTSPSRFVGVGSGLGLLRGQLVWRTHADLDLHLVLPGDGGRVYFGNPRQSFNRGRALAELDHDNVGFQIDASGNRIGFQIDASGNRRVENIVVTGRDVPRGAYGFFVHNFRSDGLRTSWSLTLTGDASRTAKIYYGSLSRTGQRSRTYIVNSPGGSFTSQAIAEPTP